MGGVGCVEPASHRVVSCKCCPGCERETIIKNNRRAPVPVCAVFVCLYPICSDVNMLLSDMRRMSDTCERTAGGGRSCHGLGEIIGAGAHLRDSFGHAGFDIRIGRAGAPRRGQRQLARYALCMFERAG